jgi:hypothetical protein
MERIGIAASKIAKGNLVLYNFAVILISVLYSLFIFVIAGVSVLFAIAIIRYVGNELTLVELDRHWTIITMVCMATLTIVIGVFNLVSLSRNIKFRQKDDE